MKVLEYIGSEPMCSGERMIVDPEHEAESVLELIAHQWDSDASHWKLLIEEDSVQDPGTHFYVVRFWDGFDGEWMDVSGPMLKKEADDLCGDKNASRTGRNAGKREGHYDDIDYYAVFPADTIMRYSAEGQGSMRGKEKT